MHAKYTWHLSSTVHNSTRMCIEFMTRFTQRHTVCVFYYYSTLCARIIFFFLLPFPPRKNCEEMLRKKPLKCCFCCFFSPSSYVMLFYIMTMITFALLPYNFLHSFSFVLKWISRFGLYNARKIFMRKINVCYARFKLNRI